MVPEQLALTLYSHYGLRSVRAVEAAAWRMVQAEKAGAIPFRTDFQAFWAADMDHLGLCRRVAERAVAGSLPAPQPV